MIARDGPENRTFIPNGRSAEFHKTADFAPVKSAPVSRLISTPKAQTDTGIKRTRKPASSRAKKPPKTDGYTWRKDGAGWELRKAIYTESDTGIRKRKLPYVGHLSKSVFAEMKKRHKGVALEKAIAQWIADHDRQEEAYGR